MISNHGKFWWKELATKDVEASKAFYKGVIGWEYEALPTLGAAYALAKAPGAEGPSAGMLQMPTEWGDVSPHWSLTSVSTTSTPPWPMRKPAAGRFSKNLSTSKMLAVSRSSPIPVGHVSV